MAAFTSAGTSPGFEVRLYGEYADSATNTVTVGIRCRNCGSAGHVRVSQPSQEWHRTVRLEQAQRAFVRGARLAEKRAASTLLFWQAIHARVAAVLPERHLLLSGQYRRPVLLLLRRQARATTPRVRVLRLRGQVKHDF